MPVSHYDFFNLRQDYSWDELEQAYKAKSEYVDKSGLNQLDKRVYADISQQYYREAKRDLVNRESDEYWGLSPYLWTGFDYFDRLERRMNRHFNRLYERMDGSRGSVSGVSSSVSYREMLQPDGSSVVLETKQTTDSSGRSERTSNSYRKKRDGTHEPLEFSEAEKLFGNHNSTLNLLR